MHNTTDIPLSTASLDQLLTASFTYYNTLCETDKTLFTKRCLRFIEGKEILGAEGFVPNNAVKILIAASAVQLTFGLSLWDLSYFDAIILYPGDFDHVPSGRKFRGETNLNGYLKLSWKSFLHGYKHSEDNINLGLHEFAHALRFNGFRGEEQDYFVHYYFEAWLASAYEVHYALKAGRPSVFRKYGGTNINEFISVCIEHYFESPQEIKLHYPHLYFSTGILLNQILIGERTYKDVRSRLFKEKNTILSGISERYLKSRIISDARFTSFLITLMPLVFTIAGSGVLSGPSLSLMVLSFFTYLRFDFYYSRLHFFGKHFSVEKGCLIFKRHRGNLLLSHLICVQVDSRSGEYEEWIFRFYKESDGHFHEELIVPKQIDKSAFLTELSKNKIAVLRK
ncbi:MAG: zinc-dependent peptidase [Bacteroidia bacterium]|nr:zinc-dependent peptidase [Bacteroidia bacterium]